MACVRWRRGRPTVDYRDKWGKRRWLSFPATPEGEAAAIAECDRIKRDGAPEVDPSITLGAYIEHFWLPVIIKRVQPGSARLYDQCARLHIPQTLKRARLRDVTRAHLKRHLATLGKEHDLAESSVAQVANVLRSIFESALDDELVTANPATGLRVALGIVAHKAEDVRAMDAAQLELFLATARLHAPGRLLELYVLAYTGMRIGEMRGLQLQDVDMDGRTLMVERQVHEDGRVGPLKGRRGKRRPRVVDMAEALREQLVPTLAARRIDDMRNGSRGPWLCYPDWTAEPGSAGARTVTQQLRRDMGRVLTRARLPQHFTPHSLRHTFARVLLERGEDPLYVSRQLGHTSVGITCDRYGQWARVKPRAGGANLLSGR